MLIDCSPNKPSKPSRAYLHLTSDQYLAQLSDRVRKTPFTDVRGSSNDSVLLGPPTVEFAPYARLPNSKSRRDARQGTIDQDPEFIDFLESLTNPLPKVPNVDAVADKEGKAEETKITPLIQYLKDKKTNKNKEPSTPAKAVKHSRQESKDSKLTQPEKKNISKATTKDSGGGSPEKKTTPAKVEKPAREAAKVVAKQPAPPVKPATSSSTLTSNAPKTAPEQSSSKAPTPSAPKQERRRERGNASAAAKILQRDLGIGQGSQTRRKRDNAPSIAPTSSGPASSSSTITAGNDAQKLSTPQSLPITSEAASTPQVSATPASPAQPPTAPAATRNRVKTDPATNVAQQQKPSSAAPSKPAALPAITPGATQAFLKHANPSQGVTEPLLEEIFAPFGTVQKVELDKKKGLAYIDFADSKALQKAIAASPVRVAEVNVVVLERKTGASLQNRNARGGSAASGIRGGAAPQSTRGGRGGGRGRGGRGSGGTPKIAVAPSVTSNTNVPVDDKKMQTSTATGSGPPEASAATSTPP